MEYQKVFSRIGIQRIQFLPEVLTSKTQPSIEEYNSYAFPLTRMAISKSCGFILFRKTPDSLKIYQLLALSIVSAICRGGLYALLKIEYDEGVSYSHLWIPRYRKNGRG
ncbi:MAG: hypothetical protein PF482_19940 [Desulfobacteraceae bacterium]|nr:hypothetical protein [Desulfobacteraceae bacterium]